MSSNLGPHSCCCSWLIDDWRTGAGVAGLRVVHTVVVGVDDPRVVVSIVAQHEDEESVQDRQHQEPRECCDQAFPKLVVCPRSLASGVESCKARSRLVKEQKVKQTSFGGKFIWVLIV